MDRSLLAAAFKFLLLLGVLALMEAGRRYGKRRLAREAEGGRAGLGVVEMAPCSAFWDCSWLSPSPAPPRVLRGGVR